MGTFDREGGGKALGSKEGIEGGLQSWAGAIIWPDPRQHWDKKVSSWTFLTWSRPVVDIVWSFELRNVVWLRLVHQTQKMGERTRKRVDWLTEPYSRSMDKLVSHISTQLFRLLSYFLLSLQITIFAEFIKTKKFRRDRERNVPLLKENRLLILIGFHGLFFPFPTFLILLGDDRKIQKDGSCLFNFDWILPGFDPRSCGIS